MIESKSQNRLKAFTLPRVRLLDVLYGRVVMDQSALPEDAKVVNIVSEWQSDSFAIVVESLEFDPVPIGEMIGTTYVPTLFKPPEGGNQ